MAPRLFRPNGGSGALAPLAVLLAFAISHASAFAASFDCDKAYYAIEREICASPDLGRLDENLAGAFAAALSASSDPDGLRKEQRAWVGQTRKICERPQAESRRDCLFRLYEARLEALGAQRPAASTPPALACEQEIGLEQATLLANRCKTLSPATRPPCHVSNPCAMIIDEIRRSCALERKWSPDAISPLCRDDPRDGRQD